MAHTDFILHKLMVPGELVVLHCPSNLPPALPGDKHGSHPALSATAPRYHHTSEAENKNSKGRARAWGTLRAKGRFFLPDLRTGFDGFVEE